MTSSVDIANVFQNKYKDLYNAELNTKEEIENFESSLQHQVASDSLVPDVSASEVLKAIESLHHYKGDGLTDLMSDNLIHGSKILAEPLAVLFSLAIRHNFVPNEWRNTIIIPIPKDTRKSLSSVENYRAISLFSSVVKTYELVLKNRLKDFLVTCDSQHGFKVGKSTNTCTLALEEVASYYMYKGSNVYSAFLDATKAFDRVDHIILFRKLLHRGVPAAYVRHLFSLYRKQRASVKWNNRLSDTFTISNGVKQGGILSPLFFCVYIDGLLESLREKGLGCFYGNHYAGALAYADDIVLLSPSVIVLQDMLNICVDYCNSHKILLNCNKSFLSIFTKSSHPIIPVLSVKQPDSNGMMIENMISYVKNPIHLGHRLQAGLLQNEDVKFHYLDFNRKANAVLNTFAGCDPFQRVDLLSTYACSFYGSQLWDISNIDNLFAAHRKALRKALCIPWRTHSGLLPYITGKNSLEVQLANRVSKFFDMCGNSSDASLRFMVASAPCNPWSKLGNNLKSISTSPTPLNNADVWYGNMIRDLLGLVGWREEIEFLCTM